MSVGEVASADGPTITWPTWEGTCPTEGSRLSGWGYVPWLSLDTPQAYFLPNKIGRRGHLGCLHTGAKGVAARKSRHQASGSPEDQKKGGISHSRALRASWGSDSTFSISLPQCRRKPKEGVQLVC